MSRRSETEENLRNAIMAQETELGVINAADKIAKLELARSMAEAADELHEIRHKLEKLISATERRRE